MVIRDAANATALREIDSQKRQFSSLAIMADWKSEEWTYRTLGKPSQKCQRSLHCVNRPDKIISMKCASSISSSRWWNSVREFASVEHTRFLILLLNRLYIPSLPSSPLLSLLPIGSRRGRINLQGWPYLRLRFRYFRFAEHQTRPTSKFCGCREFAKSSERWRTCEIVGLDDDSMDIDCQYGNSR